MNLFKKAILSCVLSLGLIAPARAALTFPNPGSVILGAAIIGGAAVSAYGGYRLIRQGQGTVGTAVILTSLFSAYWGLLILEGEQDGKFSELSAEAAGTLGISEANRDVYNAEVDQVNAIAREIGLELKRQKTDSAELARDLWLELGTELSPETMDVVVKIASQQ